MYLIDRLKETHRSILETENLKYPLTVDRIISFLENNYSWYDMPFGVWADLKFLTGADHPSDVFKQVWNEN